VFRVFTPAAQGVRWSCPSFTAVPSVLAIGWRRGTASTPLSEFEAVLSYSVLIVDDSALIRHSLRSCLEQDPDWRVCGEAEDGKVAVEKVKELHPDVVILDLQMPEMDGLAAARQITVVAPKTAMVMFTMHSDGQLLKAARAAGIKDVVSKSEGIADHLFASLRNACNDSNEQIAS
jgi:DNA-binding NarL/FixJ family response regulator